jgi:E3 ubiquitin-protein ligase TRAF7
MATCARVHFIVFLSLEKERKNYCREMSDLRVLQGNNDASIAVLSLDDDIDDEQLMKRLGLLEAAQQQKKRSKAEKRRGKRKKSSKNNREADADHESGERLFSIGWSEHGVLFVRKVPTELCCQMHGGIARDAVVAKCGHSFCSQCCQKNKNDRDDDDDDDNDGQDDDDEPTCPIDHTSLAGGCVFPNLAVRRQIDALLVHCPHRFVERNGKFERRPGNGCRDIVPFAELDDHVARCAFAQVDCKHCGKSSMNRDEMNAHLKRCGRVPCRWAGAGCTFLGTADGLERHLAQSCAVAPLSGFIAQQAARERALLDSVAKMQALLDELVDRQERTDLHVRELQLALKHQRQLQLTLQQSPRQLQSAPDVRALKRTSPALLELIASPLSSPSVAAASSSAAAAAAAAASSSAAAASPLPPLPLLPSPAAVAAAALPASATTLPPPVVDWRCNISGHTDTLWNLACNVDTLVSSSSDQTVRVWSLADLTLRATLIGHQGIVHAVALHGNKVLSGDTQGIVRVWSLLPTANFLTSFTAHANSISKLLVSTQHGKLFSGSLYEVRVWDLKNYQLLKVLGGHKHWVRGMVISEGSLFTGSGGASAIMRWSIDMLELASTFTGERSSPSIYSLEVCGNLLASATYANTIELWDIREERLIDKLIGHSGAVYGLCMLSRNRLVSCSYDTSTRIWDLNTRRCLQSQLRHKSSVESVCAHPNKQSFFTCSADLTIGVFISRG